MIRWYRTLLCTIMLATGLLAPLVAHAAPPPIGPNGPNLYTVPEIDNVTVIAPAESNGVPGVTISFDTRSATFAYFQVGELCTASSCPWPLPADFDGYDQPYDPYHVQNPMLYLTDQSSGAITHHTFTVTDLAPRTGYEFQFQVITHPINGTPYRYRYYGRFTSGETYVR